ncbi:MAG: hypothetical protein K2N88_09145 [Muribaculaceae bacterium]|nr:hypothetical protein [Muribaculaceae bacterium]
MKKLLSFAAIATGLLLLASCSGKKETGGEAQEVSTFYADQPVESGIYVADYFNITGAKERKGHFDGRVYFSLAPEQSAIYVCENGNRTKINYTLTLSEPFAPADSGRFAAKDAKGLPVMISPVDSTENYRLSFEKGESKINIDFDKTPKTTGAPIDILEQIQKAQANQSK